MGSIFRTGGGATLSIVDRLKKFGVLRLLSMFFVLRVFIPTIKLAMETKNFTILLGDIAFRLATSSHQAIAYIDQLKAAESLGAIQ